MEGVEDLRTLMTQYIGYEMGTLMKDNAFKELMVDDDVLKASGGALLGGFMHMVAKRII